MVVFPSYVILRLWQVMVTPASRCLKGHFFPVSFGDMSHCDFFSFGYWYKGKPCLVQILYSVWEKNASF